jgi:MFS family permease
MAVVTGLLYEMYRPVVSASVADLVGPEDRPRAYSLLYWAVNLGASVAPVLGGLLAARSYPLLFAADAVTTVAYGLILWIALPELRPVLAGPGDSPAGTSRGVLRDRVFLALCVLTLLFSTVFFQAFVSLPLDMRAHGVSAESFGALIALNGVLIVLLQPVAGELIRGRSQYAVLALAALLVGVGFGMNAWIGSLVLYAAAIVVWTIGEILFAPASMSIVADLAPADMRGRYQGVFAMAFTGAFAAAPALGGYVIARAGAGWLWIGCLVIGVATAAGFMALGRRQNRMSNAVSITGSRRAG